MNVFAVDDDSWDEDTIMWINQPVMGTIPLGTLPVNENDKWYTLDITNWVKSNVDTGDPLVSIALMASIESVSGNVYFDSKEWWDAEFHPFLKIETNLYPLSE